MNIRELKGHFQVIYKTTLSQAKGGETLNPKVYPHRGPFFLSTADQAQKSRRFALRAQDPLGPVICGNKKVKRNGFKPLIKPKTQKTSPLNPQAHVCCNDTRTFKIVQRKEREKFPREAPSFPPFLVRCSRY